MDRFKLTPLGQAATVLLSLSIAQAGMASSTNKGANPKGKPFVELEGLIIEVEGEVSTLQDQVDALVSDVDDLYGRIDANEDAINALQATNADLQAQINANADDVQSLAAQVSSLEAENADLEQQIADLGDADGNLQQQIDENEALITSLNISINDLETSLQDQIDHNAVLIQSIESQIDMLAVVADEQFRVENGVCPDGQTVVHYRSSPPSVTCLDRRWIDVNGTEKEVPVEYKSITIKPGASGFSRVGCGPQPHQTYFVRNFGYRHSGGIVITGLHNRAWYFDLTFTNTSSEQQVLVTETECHMYVQ